MKRALILLTVLMVGTAVLAAPKPQAVPPSSSGINPGQISIGYWSNTAGGWPILGYQFSKEIAVGGSAAYSTTGGGRYWLLLKADYNLAKIGNLQPSVGVAYDTSSSGANGTIGINYGLSTMIQNILSAGFDVILVDYTSGGGTSTTMILPTATMKASYYL